MKTFKSKLLLTSLFTISVTLACGAATAQADPIELATLTAPIEASSDTAKVRAKPEAGGRVIRTSHAAACGVSTWPGSSERGKPVAGGRMIKRTDMVACGVSTWPGSSAQAKPEAGGRLIKRAEEVADGTPASQHKSATGWTASQ